MHKIRGLFFNLLFYSWTIFIPIVMLPFVLADAANAARGVSIWLRVVRWLEFNVLGLRYRVVGLENLPPAPCLIAMQHQSAWETMKLFLLFDNPAIVMKKELLSLPLWGRYAQKMDMIPIDRQRGAEILSDMIAKAQQAKAAGRHIVIFPQGTRTAPGEKKALKFGVMKLYEALEIPLVPVRLDSGVYWPRNGFWKRPGEITVEILPAIQGANSDEVFKQLKEIIE